MGPRPTSHCPGAASQRGRGLIRALAKRRDVNQLDTAWSTMLEPKHRRCRVRAQTPRPPRPTRMPSGDRVRVAPPHAETIRQETVEVHNPRSVRRHLTVREVQSGEAVPAHHDYRAHPHRTTRHRQEALTHSFTQVSPSWPAGDNGQPTLNGAPFPSCRADPMRA